MFKVYRVGGSVRDELLGAVPHDNDYVVVGATEEEFLAAYEGAKNVGANFPVFMYEGDEYAFARTERKSGSGRRGFDVKFDPTVTLADDLLRRDLTVNTFAVNVADSRDMLNVSGALEDLGNKVLRHVSEAFVEDPLRVFRVARFAAKFPDWSVAPETMDLCCEMVHLLGEVSPDRVFGEMCRAFETKLPSRFFRFLDDVGALHQFFPEVAAMRAVPAGPELYHPEGSLFNHTMNVLDATSPVPLWRFGALVHDFGKLETDPKEYPHHHGHEKMGLDSLKAFCRDLRVSCSFTSFALFMARRHMSLKVFDRMRPGKAAAMLVDMGRIGVTIDGALAVSKADGNCDTDLEMLAACHDAVMRVKLPAEHHGKGKVCGEILTSLRGHELKRVRGEFLRARKQD